MPSGVMVFSRRGMMNDAEPFDALGSGVRARLESELSAALKRRPTYEARLAGVMRALAPLSEALRRELLKVLETMIRRGSFDRPLYGAVVRALADSATPALPELIARAVVSDDTGTLSTLSAACFCRGKEVGAALARAAVSRHAHVAFAAEVARLSRGDSDGAAVRSIAPKIKESHRIALCLELLAPLLAAPALPRAIAPALAVLRDSERHLGRWLLLAEIATRSGDAEPKAQARERARSGPQSARAAWSLVVWALEPEAELPSVRPTVELMARLSDRPSGNKDTTFLFRLAAARVPSARPMLESLVKSGMLGEECSIRAMLHLFRDYGQDRYRQQLGAIAATPRKDPLRGLAAAALYDAGDAAPALAATTQLAESRHLSALGWSALIAARQARAYEGSVLSEPAFRRVQLGWVE